MASSRKFFSLFVVCSEVCGLLKAFNTRSTGWAEVVTVEVPAVEGSMKSAK